MSSTLDFTKKIKKKMELSDGFSVNHQQQDNLKPKNAHTELQIPVCTDIPLSVHTDSHISSQTSNSQLTSQTKQPIQETQFDNIPKMRSVSKAKFQKKMTFNISEECHDHFLKLYAIRMYQGRYTEKGEIINEALNLLWEQEKNNGYIK